MDIGSIVAKIILDKSGFDSAVVAVQNSLSAMGTAFKENNKKIQDMGKEMAIAGGIITGALTAMVMKTIDSRDAIFRLTQQTGMTAEVLSALGYAARMTGGSIDNVAQGAKFMQRNIVEAAEGNLKLRDAFKELGVPIEALVKMTPDQQFDALAKGVAEVENPTLRTRLAMEVFGRGAVELLPVLSNGAKGLDEWKQKASDAGRVMSGETAKAGEEMEEKFRNLKEAMSAAVGTIATLLMPAVLGIVEPITKVVKGITAWIKENPVLGTVIVTLAGTIGVLLTAIGSLAYLIPKTISLIQKVASGFMAIPGPIQFAIIAITAAVVASKLLTAAFDALGRSYEKAMAEISDAAAKQTQESNKFYDYRKIATEEEKKLITSMVAAKRAEGKEIGVIWKEINEYLRQNSAGFKTWEAETTKSTKKVGIVIKATAKEEVEALETTKMARELSLQDLINNNNQKIDTENAAMLFLDMQKDQQALKDETRMKATNTIWQQLMQSKQQLEIQMVANAAERENIEYAQEQQRIIQANMDTIQKDLALEELEKQHQAKLDKIKKDADDRDDRRGKQTFQRTMQLMSQTISQLSQMFSQYYQQLDDKAQSDYDKKKKWIEDNIKDEGEKSKAMKALDEELAKQKAKNSAAAARAQKAASMAEIIVNTASAIVNALAHGVFPFNLIAAALMGAMGAAQLAIASHASAAEGGIVSGPGLVMVGDNPSGREMLVPLERAEEMGFGGGGGRSYTFNISVLDGRGLKEIVRNDIIPLLEEANRNEYFQISAATVRA